MSYDVTSQIGIRIQQKLKERKKKQKELSQYLRMKNNTLSQKLTGKSPLIVDELSQIADFFNTPPEIFISNSHFSSLREETNIDDYLKSLPAEEQAGIIKFCQKVSEAAKG